MGAIIALGVVGGVVVLAIIVAIILCCKLKSQSEVKKKQMDFGCVTFDLCATYIQPSVADWF